MPCCFLIFKQRALFTMRPKPFHSGPHKDPFPKGSRTPKDPPRSTQGPQGPLKDTPRIPKDPPSDPQGPSLLKMKFYLQKWMVSLTPQLDPPRLKDSKFRAPQGPPRMLLRIQGPPKDLSFGPQKDPKRTQGPLTRDLAPWGPWNSGSLVLFRVVRVPLTLNSFNLLLILRSLNPKMNPKPFNPKMRSKFFNPKILTII